MSSPIRPQNQNVAPRVSGDASASSTPAQPGPETAQPPQTDPDRYEGGASSSEQAHVTGRDRAAKLSLSTGSSTRAPAPDLPAIDPARVPADAALQQQTATSRARLLGRLASTQREAEALPPGQPRDDRLAETQAAVNRVVENTDGTQLSDTLQVAARNRTLGAITETIGLEGLLDAGRERGVNVNEVLATSDTVKERGLTDYERGQVDRNFAGTLDPETVRFKFSTGVQTAGAGAMVIGNKVHVDPTDPRWGFEPGTTRPANPRAHDEYNETLLAHEPAHVWSYQHQGSQYAVNSMTEQAAGIADTGDRSAAYKYAPGEPSFFNYGEEQRAMIVQDHVAAQRARERGESTVDLRGQRRNNVPVDEALRDTEGYVGEMRAAGPGDPSPPGEAHPVDCAHCNLSVQDGIADAVANQADALLAGVGQASMNAVQSGDPLAVIGGAAGIGGVVAASLMTREQNGSGASGGGSAILDQAGIPRGVEVSGEVGDVELTGAARFGYDAGERYGAFNPETRAYDQQLFAPPASPRVELEVGAAGQVGETSLQGTAAAEVGLDGSLRQAAGTFSVRSPDLSVDGQGSVDLRGAENVAQASVDVQGNGFGVQAAGSARWNESGVQAAALSGHVDTAHLSVSADAAFGPDWQFQSADLAARARGPGWSLYTDATFRPGGLDAIGGGGTTQLGGGTSLSASARAEDLLSGAPTYSGTVAVNGEGGSLAASGRHNPTTGQSSFRAGLVIPLKP